MGVAQKCHNHSTIGVAKSCEQPYTEGLHKAPGSIMGLCKDLHTRGTLQSPYTERSHAKLLDVLMGITKLMYRVNLMRLLHVLRNLTKPSNRGGFVTSLGALHTHAKFDLFSY